jgi:hypothetical protein
VIRGKTVSVIFNGGVTEGIGVRDGIILHPTSSNSSVQMSRRSHPGCIRDAMDASDSAKSVE